MPTPQYVLCKFKKRWWPAKVSSRSRAFRGPWPSVDKAASVRVEIMCLNKQASVRWVNVKPLTEDNIEEIASTFDQSKQRCSPNQELMYRRALREALDILQSAGKSTACTPSKRRKDEPQNLEDQTPRTFRRALPACRDSPKAGGGPSPLPPDSVPHGEESPSAIRASPSCKVSVAETRGLSGGGPSPGDLHGVSETTAESKAQLGPGSEGRWRRSSKEEEEKQGPVKSGLGRKRCRSSAASQSLVQTSTPASHRSPSSPASVSKKLSANPGRRKILPGSPPERPPGVSSFPDEGAPPVGKGTPVPNGTCDLVGPRGAHKDHPSVGGSSPSRKRRRRLCLENLNPAPGTRESLLEHEREEEMDRPAEERQVETLEEEEGWESPCDLSLSPIRRGLLSPAFRDEEEEEEELPSLLPFQEPGSIEAGKLVWCKLQRYPYWPAVVRKVKRKARKASVFFVEKSMEEKTKGLSVSLKNLKPFDCQEKQKLIEDAREDYNDEINWCINLIEDYRIRVGCCSFQGSFLEYCADAMSYPVRKETPGNLSQMNFPQAEDEGDSSLSETPATKLPKKVLPDRMRASRDRANGKIVDFIVKARGADGHLSSVLKNERPSRWLAQFLHARPYPTSIETYLEDDAQQDLVFRYLQEMYRELDASALPLVNGDRVRFILDVLFPEAIIYAISAIERIDYKKAEEKYIRGPLVSQRERERFEEEILEQKRRQQMEKASPDDGV